MPITRTYPPEIFRLVPVDALSRSHFESHPIWAEFCDFEEIEEIVAWGVDRTRLEAELKRFGANDHCAYPILQPYPLPGRMRLYVKALCVTAGGARLDGYVMNDGALLIALFVEGEEFVLSRHPALADLTAESRDRLRGFEHLSGDPIFPVRFSTDFLDDEGRLIEGTFDLATDARDTHQLP